MATKKASVVAPRKLLQVVVTVEAPSSVSFSSFKTWMRETAEHFLLVRGGLPSSAAKRRSGVRKYP